MNFLRGYYQQNRREIAKDILVILVLVKFSLEYMFRQGDLAPAFGIALLIAGVMAIAVRSNIFSSLLSITAIILFLLDIHFQGAPYSTALFGLLTLTAMALYVIMRIFSR